MVESLQVSAQLTTVVEVDVTSISRLRDSVKQDFAAREGVKLSFMPFFAKAAIDALKAHPALNAAIDTEKGEVTYFDHENLAIAVDTEKGLLTPVIKNAGDLNVAGLARKIADLAERTRANKISPDELSGGTFTLTNTGSRGALFDTPIINQPQVAILGTGTVVKRPVVIDDADLGETIAVRQMVYLALTYDHRLVDGADAARFLSDVKAAPGVGAASRSEPGPLHPGRPALGRPVPASLGWRHAVRPRRSLRLPRASLDAHSRRTATRWSGWSEASRRPATRSRWDPHARESTRRSSTGADVVANLAGAPCPLARGHESYRRTFLDSRVVTTRMLAEAVARSERRPACSRRTASPGTATAATRSSPRRPRPTPTRSWPRSPATGRRATAPAARPAPGSCVMRTGVVLDSSAAR